MKTKLAIFFGLTVIAVSAYAYLVKPPYDNTKPPMMSLPSAYSLAIATVGSATNQFHCVSAVVNDELIGDGEWYFTFYSTNSKAMPKLIAVGFNGKIIEDSGFR
jgi:hypothetical protein